MQILGLSALALLILVGTTVLAAPYGSRSLHTGSAGGDVIQLQRLLTDLGYETGGVNGLFDRQTREALLAFQEEYGLVPDGIASRWTFRALDRAQAWRSGWEYTLKKGDTLGDIAARYGTSVASLIWLNQLPDGMTYTGQSLRIPPPQGVEGPSYPIPSAPGAQPPGAQAPGAQPPGAQPPSAQPPSAQAPGAQAPGAQPPGAPPSASGVDSRPADPLPPSSPSSYLLIPPPGAPPHRYTVLGFYAEDWEGDTRALTSLKQAGGQVDMAVNFALRIDADGSIHARPYPELALLAASQGVEVHGLVHNYLGQNFDANVARAVLSSPQSRTRAARNILAAARQFGLAGINLDLEHVPPDQRHNYTALVRELSGLLQAEGLTLSLSIPAKTRDEPKNSWSGAFDYKALGELADWIIPMAYDEHLPGFPAGPIASSGWVERVAAYAAAQMPPRKVLLGVAAYAYDWRTGTTVARGLSAPGAADLAARNGATVQWDEQAQVPYFTYVRDGLERIVYFENAASLEAKLAAVKKHGLGGIGIWRLGLEDPQIWPVIERQLR